AVDGPEPEMAAADRELIAVEATRRRAGGPVALGVEHTAVAGTAEATRGLGRNESDGAHARPRRKVATTNSPSGKARIGPRSTARRRWPKNEGSNATPAAGNATPRATRAPRPSVARSSRRLRGNRSGLVSCALASGAGAGRSVPPAPRTQAKPAASVIRPPREAITHGFTTNPTSRTATPIAKLIGWIVAALIASSLLRQRPWRRSRCSSQRALRRRLRPVVESACA